LRGIALQLVENSQIKLIHEIFSQFYEISAINF
jgi:hypothetical protein